MALLGSHLRKHMAGVFALKVVLSFCPNHQIIDGIGDPLGSRFDKRPAQVWKFLRHTLIDQVIECAHRRKLEARKYILAKLIVVAEISRAGMNANG